MSTTEKMIFMLAFIGSAGVGFDGEFYPANADGVVEVPARAKAELTAHGLTECKRPEETDPTKAKLAELESAVKAAAEALKVDKTNADLKAAKDNAVQALKDFKESLKKV